MDMSKLPKLSQTPPAPPATDAQQPGATDTGVPPAVWCRSCHAPNAPGTKFCGECGARLESQALDYRPADVRAGTGAEVWVSAILGIIMMLVGRNFGAFLLARITGQPFHTGVEWSEAA